MKQVGGECPLQGIMPTGKGTPGQEARVFLAFNVLLPLNKGKKCIYALRESSKAWQVIWVFTDAGASKNESEIFCALEILVGLLEGIPVCKAGVLHVLADLPVANCCSEVWLGCDYEPHEGTCSFSVRLVSHDSKVFRSDRGLILREMNMSVHGL